MIRVIFLFSLFISGNAWAGLKEPTVFSDKKISVLGADVELALRLWNKDFNIFKYSDYMEPVRYLFETDPQVGELPYAVTGHFNADRILDVAVMGNVSNSLYVLMIVSDKGRDKYNVHIVRSETSLDPTSYRHTVEGELYTGLNVYLSRYISVDREVSPNDARKSRPKKVSRRQTAQETSLDSLQIEVFRSAATKRYVFKNGRVVPYQASKE